MNNSELEEGYYIVKFRGDETIGELNSRKQDDCAVLKTWLLIGDETEYPCNYTWIDVICEVIFPDKPENNEGDE